MSVCEFEMSGVKKFVNRRGVNQNILPSRELDQRCRLLHGLSMRLRVDRPGPELHHHWRFLPSSMTGRQSGSVTLAVSADVDARSTSITQEGGAARVTKTTTHRQVGTLHCTETSLATVAQDQKAQSHLTKKSFTRIVGRSLLGCEGWIILA